MQPEVEKLFERLQTEIDRISTYIQTVLDAENDLGINQVKLISFLEYNFFREKKNSSIKELIEHDYHSAIKAKIQGDFVEFCRYICLQLELLLSRLYWNNTEVSSSLTARYHKFIKQSKTPVHRDLKSVIPNAITIRNIASHRDIIAPVDIRIKRQGNVAYLIIDNLEPDRETDIKEDLRNLCRDRRWNTATVNISEKYGNCRAYVDVSCIDLELTPDDVRNDIEQRIREVHERFGRNVQVEFNSDKQPDSNELNKNNELNQFFLDSNYEELIEALLWFIKAFEQYYDR